MSNTHDGPDEPEVPEVPSVPEIDDLMDLPSGLEPPAWLEDRVVGALAREGLLRPARWTTRRVGLIGGAAAGAAIVVFAAGLLAGTWWDGAAATPAPAGRHFMLLLYEDASYVAPAAGRGPERVKEYRRWADTMARAGHLVDGAELKDDAETPPDSRHVAGFFILAARDRREALDLAADCPHLKYRGRIEVREIDED